MIRERLNMTDEQIAAFCARWHVTEFALFGSILGDDFTDESDIDVLVTWTPDGHPTLFDLVTMQDELSSITGRAVDVVPRAAIEASRNFHRRKAILSRIEVVHDAAA